MKIKCNILKHIKTGGYYYQILPFLDWRREADMHSMFAYRSLLTQDEAVRNMVFLRPIEERNDGRFEIASNEYDMNDTSGENQLISLIHTMNDTYRRTWRMICVGSVCIALMAGMAIGKFL